MTTFTVLLAGDITPTARLAAQIAGTHIIAADSGMRHAAALRVVPELWLGDFDSASDPLLAAHVDVPRLVFPAAKSMTDGELAIAEALQRGATGLVLVGGFGGRTDHAMAHIQLAIRLAQKGVQTLITSGEEEGYPLLPGERTIDLPPGSRFSVVPVTDLPALTLTGVRWPLDRRFVPAGSTLTISNEAFGPIGIALEGGLAIVIAQPEVGQVGIRQ
ncbi:MAG TPA: thiamine diphosphokinase [Aestuariivirgaceae bacterium]|jgi:thiamine pyrophosphokinase|nr:thiamine diphosphokinase [Aestuariivirgaceae bacterium]